jgi:hypothetical protein
LRCRSATSSLRRGDSDFVVFCFSKSEDADSFCRALWREAVAFGPAITLKNKLGGPKAALRADFFGRVNAMLKAN